MIFLLTITLPLNNFTIFNINMVINRSIQAIEERYTNELLFKFKKIKLKILKLIARLQFEVPLTGTSIDIRHDLPC